MKKKDKKRYEGTSYWQSYSDMMAALLLMFVLIMSFTLLQSLKSYQEKIEEETIAQQQLDEKQKQLSETQKELNDQKDLLNEQQQKLQNLIGIKSELIEALSKEFENSDMSIVVDAQTGAIAFDSSVLFDYDDYELKKTAKKFLNEFFPKYFDVLMSDEFQPYISEIIIEGHTDDEGTYIYNLNLSQKRAFSIAEYCLDSKNKLLSRDKLNTLKTILTANGKSSNNLILKADGSVDKDASRRVEFKFRLKDDEMIQEMKDILEN